MTNPLSRRKKKILAERNLEERFLIARQYARDFRWQEVSQTATTLTFTKTGYVAIPEQVTITWDAESCILTSTLFHEDRQRWSVMKRRLAITKHLFHIFGYPRTHFQKGSGVELVSVEYSKEQPITQ